MSGNHKLMRFPHPERCTQCRDLWLCNVCGRYTLPSERCANGRCRLCHRRVCSPAFRGVVTHGAGTLGAAELEARIRENGGELPASMVIPDEPNASAACQRLVFLGEQFSCERKADGWHFIIDVTEDRK